MVEHAKCLIRLVNVWKTYKMGDTEVHALRGLNLEVHRGEFLVLMGPSGSGKSTLVNHVGCLDIPTKGEIYLENKNIAHLSESALAQIRGRKIGFVFQTFNLIPTLTAIENVMLPMTFQDVPRNERFIKAKDLLTKVDLGERLNHLPSELSGGQQQRVAIARALSNDPEVILADEPTGNLDSHTGTKVMELLESLHEKEKKTIIMVTHDVRMSKFGTRTELLQDGVIVKK